MLRRRVLRMMTWSMVGHTHVIARDRLRGMVYLGGLGVMGVGRMWFQEQEYMADLDGWDGAPERGFRDPA